MFSSSQVQGGQSIEMAEEGDQIVEAQHIVADDMDMTEYHVQEHAASAQPSISKDFTKPGVDHKYDLLNAQRRAIITP